MHHGECFRASNQRKYRTGVLGEPNWLKSKLSLEFVEPHP